MVKSYPSRGRVAATLLLLASGVSLYLRSQSQLQIGYSVLTADPGTTLPVASSLFTYTNSKGVLVSQAGVSAAEPLLSGRIYVDETGTQTGLALVNVSAQNASITLVLRDALGKEVDRKTQSLGAGRHLARYVSQLFSNSLNSFTGSLTFESDQKLASITLRESRNVQGEPLYTTLPIVDLALPAGNDRLVFPQIAAGAGYYTQLILLNATSQKLTGQIILTGSDGKPLPLRLTGNVTSQFSYQIEPQGTYRAEFDSPLGLATGYAVVHPDSGSRSPSGVAIFQFKQNDYLVTEAGVAATSTTTSARIFVDNDGSYTGVAIANPDGVPTTVTFTLLDRYGVSEDSTTRTLAAAGHLAIFAHELFPNLTDKSTGLLEISSSNPVAAVTLKLTVNDRGEQVLTTLPVADMNRLPAATSLVFPQIAIGEGFSTRLIFINADKAKRAGGKMSFYQSDGMTMSVQLGNKTDSQFNYEVAAGGGRQFLPGNTAKIASISLLDPSSNLATTEVVVNEGKSVRAKVLVLDTTGAARDDYDLTYSSLGTDLATVDSTGNIEGKRAGFSTLTVSSGGIVTTGTITVVAVDSGVAGYEITGVTQDLARRLYLASSNDHTILLAQDLKQAPAIYAGVAKTAGLKNDARLQSWFKNPAFVAYNQAEGSLYVSDSANHVIRRVQAGTPGKVETLAGSGAAGSTDGPVKEAAFNNPQGVALDTRGNLWVADSGNHTIRRINFTSGTVTTVAGKAGSAGWIDGIGANARFSAPVGIAIEPETLAQATQREAKGLPPPPITLVVADTGNGVIRRINEKGEVTTIRLPGPSASMARYSNASASSHSAVSPVSFRSPQGIAVDPSGNIYVSEFESGSVKAILQTGEIVSAAQKKTFDGPKGIAISLSGRIVVADRARSAHEISYGKPEITSITPDRVSNRGGEKITVKGNNFAPDTILVAGGVLISSANLVVDTQTIVFTAPILPSGLTTVTVQNRGGLSQKEFLVDAAPLEALTRGQITTVAGGTTFIGDGGPATSAGMAWPFGMAVDSAGNLFIGDNWNHRIRKVDAATATINTVAGIGEQGFAGDNGPATAAQLANPGGIALDAEGNLYFADSTANLVRKVVAATGIIITVAGNGQRGFSGDNGPATAAQLASPMGVAIDASANLFIADRDNHSIRKVDTKGIITTIAGTGQAGFSGDDGPASTAQLRAPYGIALDAAGNLLIADSENARIRKIDRSTNIIKTIAGGGTAGLGENGLATAAQLGVTRGIAVDSIGNLFIASTAINLIRKVDVATGKITTLAGTGLYGFSGDNGPATAAQFRNPEGIALDASGNLLIADTYNYRIRKIDAKTGAITTMAGNGEPGAYGENGRATAARLKRPESSAFDAAGNLYFADTYHYRVRKVDSASRLITTVAGTGDEGRSGDNVPATSVPLGAPSGVVLDSAGNLLIADATNSRIRKVNVATNLITTIAGTGQFGFSGDGGAAIDARFRFPTGLAIDAAGNLFIADTVNNRIRRVDASTHLINTIAGTGEAGFGGDNGPAIAAQLWEPRGIALDSAGNLFIADSLNNRICRVDGVTRILTTIAGTGQAGFSGDNGPATAARLREPSGVAVDAAGNVFVADTWTNRVRRIDASTRIITTLAGTGLGGSLGDNGPATAARLNGPRGVTFDASGNLLIMDTYDNRIRAIRGPIR